MFQIEWHQKYKEFLTIQLAMNNPVKIYNSLYDTYIKYINSGLPFFRDEYNEERNELLKETGTIA